MTGDKGLTAYRSFAFNSSCRGKDYEDMYRIVCRLLGSPGICLWSFVARAFFWRLMHYFKGSSGSNVVFDPGCTVLECTPTSGWTGVKKSQTGVIRVNCKWLALFFDIPQHKMAWSICFNALLEQVWIVWTEPILFNTCWPSILPAQQLFCLAFAQIIGCMLNWTWYTGVCGWIDRILAFLG